MPSVGLSHSPFGFAPDIMRTVPCRLCRGAAQGVLDGAIIFFVPFLCIDHLDANQITDVGSLGKVVYIGMLGSVTLEVALAARFWTYPFALLVFVSYFLVYPFIFGYSELLQAAGIHDPVQVRPVPCKVGPSL